MSSISYTTARDHRTSLNQLKDVQISNLVNGQVLGYDGTKDIWVNGNISSGVTTFAALTDVDVTPVQPNQSIHYDATGPGRWVQTPELVVDASSRNVEIVTDGAVLVDTVGTQTFDSDALISINGQGGSTLESTAGNVLVSSSVGNITVDSVAGLTQIRGSTGVELRTPEGTAFISETGSTRIVAPGPSSLELEAAQNSVILRPVGAGVGSIVVVDKTDAATYAADVALDPQGVPNVQFVTDAISNIDLSTFAKRDGTDTGAVTIGSSDNTVGIIANSSIPTGYVLFTDGTGATTVSSQDANLTLLTQSTAGNIVCQPGSASGFITTTIGATDYAARCVGNTDAIVNEQRLQDVSTTAVSNKAAKDYSDTGPVNLGSTDNDTTLRAGDGNLFLQVDNGNVDVIALSGLSVARPLATPTFNVATALGGEDISASGNYIAPNFTSLLTKGYNLQTFNPTTAISPLTDLATNVVNQHFGGRRIKCLAGANLVSGRCVTFRNGATSTILEVVYVNGGVGEEVAQSQFVGVTLTDATAGNLVDIAIDGICSILAGAAGTAVRGGELVIQSGSTGKLQAPGSSSVSDEAIAGVSLTQGAVGLNAPVLVWVRPGFEHF